MKFSRAIPVLVLIGIGLAALLFRPQPQKAESPSTHSEPAAETPQSASSPRKQHTASSWDLVQLTDDMTEEELLQLARNLVSEDAARTLAWAQSLNDSPMRQRLLFAVVQAWAEADPRAAIDWASRLEPEQRIPFLERAFVGAVKQPKLALEVARSLLAENPALGSDCAALLVSALSNSGEFQLSLQFLKELPAEAHTSSAQALFSRWSRVNPQEAARALDSIEDKNLRAIAFNELIRSWASDNSPGLAAYALTLPAGSERTSALNKALDNWSLQDPAAVGEWLNSVPPSPEFDAAIAAMIAKTDSLNRSPNVAMSWVESIGDTAKRREALVHVMKEWTQSAPETAWKYFARMSWLTDADRAALRKDIERPADGDFVPD